MLMQNLGLWGYPVEQLHRPLCERTNQPLCSVRPRAASYPAPASNKQCFLTPTAYRGTINTYDGESLCLPWSRSPSLPSRFPNASLENSFCRDPNATGRPWCYDAARAKSGTRWR